MAKKLSILLTGLITISALGAFTLLLTAPSWSSPARLFVNGSAPESLVETSLTLRGGGFSPATSLWLVPERSIRSATTATLETYGNPHHFIHRDDHLYVANGVGGFFIAQGLQSSTPSISGVLNSGGQGVEVILHRDEALLAAGTSGLQIIDIRDDANPRLLAALKSVAPALSVASSGKIAYVATGNGVQIVDLTDPRHPRHLGKLPDIPEAYKLSCDDKILIIATATGGWLYDIRQSEQPRRLAALPVPGGHNTVMTRQGEILYWATKGLRESRLYSLDLSRPETPIMLSSVPLNGVPHGINSSDDQLAIALGTSGTQIFSLSAGPQLTTGTTVMAKSRTRYSLLLGNDLWVADGSGELLRLNQQKSEELYTPPILTTISPRIQPVVTPHLFILGDETELTIHARWDDTAPILLARLPITGLTQQYLSADQRQLWLVVGNVKPLNGGKLIGVDISTPYAPRITAELSFPTTPVIVGERGTTLVIATATPVKSPLIWNQNSLFSITYSDFLHFIDISLPEAPSEFLSYPLGSSCAGITLVGNSLALMQIDGLFRLIDLSEKHAPKELGSLQMPWLQTAAWSSGIIQIAVKDKVAFISSPLGVIASIDLNNPRQPKNLGSFSLDGPISSLLTNDHLLLVDVKKKGVVFIDLKKPRAPVLLGSIPLPGYLQKGTIQDGLFWYVVSDSKGLWSFPLPRRLQSSATDDQLVASLAQPPPAGAYRFWLSDAQTCLLVPGVSWSNRPQQER